MGGGAQEDLREVDPAPLSSWLGCFTELLEASLHLKLTSISSPNLISHFLLPGEGETSTQEGCGTESQPSWESGPPRDGLAWYLASGAGSYLASCDCEPCSPVGCPQPPPAKPYCFPSWQMPPGLGQQQIQKS